MKRLILFLCFIFIGSYCGAAYLEGYQLNQASFTQTNEGPVPISSGTNMRNGYGLLIGVQVSSPMANGTITFADAFSSGTTGTALGTLSTVAVVSLAGGGNAPVGTSFYIPFEIKLSSGLSYTTSNNSKGVTIIYKSLKPQ